MVVRIIEAQYDIEGSRYLVVYGGYIRRNGGCIIARKKPDGVVALHKVEIYRLKDKNKIGDIMIEEGELLNRKEFGKNLLNFLKINSVID